MAPVIDDQSYRMMTKNQFLKGYADSDSVYDLSSSKKEV
jgi:hypothetical protein